MSRSRARKPAHRLGTDPAPSQILRMREVLRLTGLGRTTVHVLVKAGEFPEPVHLTATARGWRARDVLDWINDRERGGRR